MNVQSARDGNSVACAAFGRIRGYPWWHALACRDREYPRAVRAHK